MKIKHIDTVIKVIAQFAKSPRKLFLVAIIPVLIASLWLARPVDAAISFQSAGTGNNAGGATSLVITKPAILSTGDVMIAVVSVRGGSGTTVGAPAGWTVVNSNFSTTTLLSLTFYKIATSSEGANYTFTFNTTQKASGVIAAYSGVASVYSIDNQGVQVNGSLATMTAPSITTTLPNTMLVGAYSTATGTTFAGGSGMTSRGSDTSSGAGAATRTTSGIQDAVQASATATGTKTATAGAAAVNIGHLIALTPKLEMNMSAYRWYANADSVTPGTSLAAQDTAASSGAGSMRLQMLTHITGGKTTPYDGVKLRYASRGADNVCDANGSGEAYQEIVSKTKTAAQLATSQAVSSASGSQLWSNSQYALSADNLSASVGVDGNNPLSMQLRLTNFGFNVPSTATIYGIKITTNAWSDFYSAGTDQVTLHSYLIKSGTVQATDSFRVLSSTSSSNYETYPTSMYGNTLTPADVNSSGFGVMLQAEASFGSTTMTAFVNSLAVQVIYSDGGTVQFQDNTTPSDGVAAVNGGISHGADSIAAGTYNETNMSTTRTGATGQTSGDILHDFSLDLTSLSAGTYCFMAFDSSGNALGQSHTVVPQITILPPSITQANYRWFANANSATPGSPLAAQDTATSVSPQTPVRLRQRLAVDTGSAGQNYANFKLQYAERSGVCDIGFSGETYVDAAPVTSQSVVVDNGYSQDDGGSGAEVIWSNDGDAKVINDGLSAYHQAPVATGSSNSHWLRTSTYGASIPSTATINGIEVMVIAQVTSGADATFTDVRLARAGVTESVGKTPGSVIANNAYFTHTFGSPTDLWGASWTPSDVNNSGFGAAIRTQMFAQGMYGNVQVDAFQIKIYYTAPGTGSAPIAYYDNSTPADLTTISSSGSDPTNGARPTVYQSYREIDPFTNNVATIPAGSDGMWDLALTTDTSVTGKTYCFRVVKSDGSQLDLYSQIPEITFSGGGGGGGPTTDQKLRGGRSVQNGVKSPFEL